MTMPRSTGSNLFLRWLLTPLLIYSAAFFVLTYPLCLLFNEQYFTDLGDGYQMIWDLWWIRYAILHLHQSPFFTAMLHYPGGSSLLLHSLAPFNGLLGIVLQLLFSEIQTFNVLVIFAFVGSGVTAFWLCAAVTRRYWESVGGGFAFVFCSYRWAHYFGHLPLISTEWMPLFLLGLLWLLRRPRIGTAILTAAVLLILLMIDQYQFMDCIFAAIIIVIFALVAGRFRRRLGRKHLTAGTIFLVAVISSCGPILLAMARAAGQGDLTGGHDPDLFSADLLGPWVPDWAWLYNRWTALIWGPIRVSYTEKSVCIGPAVVIAAIIGWLGRPRNSRSRENRFTLGSQSLFAVMAISFMLLSFGPTWRLWTIELTTWTPYHLLMILFPPIRISGCAARMMIMAQLAIAVLATAGLARLRDLRLPAARVILIFLFIGVFIFEAEPRTLMTCPPIVPKWVAAVRDDPAAGGVIDLVEGGEPQDMFYQTIHHRPIAQGDLSRIPTVTEAATTVVLNDVDQRRYGMLASMGFAFLVQGTHLAPLHLPVMYADRLVRVYRLNTTGVAIPIR